MKDKQLKKRIFRRNLVIAIIVLLIVIILVPIQIPTSYYIESLGDAKSLKSVVTVDQKKDDQKGSFMYTDVGVRGPINLLMMGLSFTDPHATILDRDDLMSDQTSEEFENLQQYYMTDAQNTAIDIAFKAAGKKVRTDYLGVYVMSISNDSAFKGKLKVGDTINEVNGVRIKTGDQFRKLIKQKKTGTKVTIRVTRDKQVHSYTAKLITIAKNTTGVGIVPVDHTKVNTDQKVNFDIGDVGGPSAGLMFTLQIYDLLKGTDLRHGQNIAGTGTIEKDGSVGPIGGIDKKIVSAAKSGAEYFLAPDDPITKDIKKADPNYVNNYHLALQAKKKFSLKIKVIPVKSFSGALKSLEQIK